ncbi:MAG: hypothetical protein J7500_16290 [Sphingomonas sp.]|uniref:hypothetical protein n=1 Tax=Sphingomonas sp. TaxID=28214 RepID=UPI001AFEC689|nr:hypothetical protein [Sphingomonas sp.]MBO9624269.1 hypothetical protein [Sphingomonas sp.]
MAVLRAMRLHVLQPILQTIAVAGKASPGQMTFMLHRSKDHHHRGFEMLSLIALYIEHRRAAR